MMEQKQDIGLGNDKAMTKLTVVVMSFMVAFGAFMAVRDATRDCEFDRVNAKSEQSLVYTSAFATAQAAMENVTASCVSSSVEKMMQRREDKDSSSRSLGLNATHMMFSKPPGPGF
jgi:hypothetical protein